MTERDQQRQTLKRIAADDPRLAARIVLMTLPAAAAGIRDTLAYRLDVEELGSYRVAVADGGARVDEASGGDGEPVDFRLTTDARTLVDMAIGEAKPLGLMLRGRLRIRGKRRKALKLRAMSDADVLMEDVARAGGTLDPDLLYSSLPYIVDPKWTEGHDFTVRYEVSGPGGGTWHVDVPGGKPLSVSRDAPEGRDITATAKISFDDYQRMAAGQLTPDKAMQEHRTIIDGHVYDVTMLGRWIDRGQGRDDAELKREGKQRRLQQKREGLYALGGARPGSGDPGHSDASGNGSGLLGYRQLYALWESQNWKAHELDFTIDKEQWVATPAAAQQNTIWSLGSFYVGEERVTADLAPFLLAAPSGEIELFLATQLVDEARHAAFFDRFGGEVMALSADDLRGRMAEVEQKLLSPWREVFDDGLRDVARRIQAKPDDFDLFVEGITTYHMVIEGFLAVTGQTLIRDWMLEHHLYPGFCEGFGLVERDEHRHVAFGVKFLRDAIEQDPRHRETVERTVLELAPRAAHVFVPPYASSAVEFTSYGYDSREIYGHAYRTLKRRMKVLGIEIPPPEELMPGPISDPLSPAEDAGASGSNGANGASASNGSGAAGEREAASAG